MLFSDTIVAGSAVTFVFLVSILIYRPKNRSAFYGASLATIFALGCLLAVDEIDNRTVFVITCLIWIPLTVEDAIHQHVSAKLLYFSTLLTIIMAINFGSNSLLDITVLVSLLIILMICIKYLEHRRNQTFIGSADYFAGSAFMSMLPVTSIGIWLIVFPMLGILGYFLNLRSAKQIPLLPYMLAGWCVVFSQTG
jgi:uncharacterized membrane protein YobD (UPF0266 family)